LPRRAHHDRQDQPRAGVGAGGLRPVAGERAVPGAPLFIDAKAQQQARQLDIDWATASTVHPGRTRIEQIARTDLNMTPLTPARTQYLTEGAK
jgi:hypothetical protein